MERSVVLLYTQAITTKYESKLVGSSGLEPPTSRLSGVRSNHLSYEPTYGGDKRDRTADPLLAKQVLSQLSYTPISFGAFVGPYEPQKLNNDLKRILQSVSTLLTLEF